MAHKLTLYLHLYVDSEKSESSEDYDVYNDGDEEYANEDGDESEGQYNYKFKKYQVINATNNFGKWCLFIEV